MTGTQTSVRVGARDRRAIEVLSSSRAETWSVRLDSRAVALTIMPLYEPEGRVMPERMFTTLIETQTLAEHLAGKVRRLSGVKSAESKVRSAE